MQHGSPCIEALALLVEILLEPGEEQDIDRARMLCEQLSIMDKIREAYWRWRGARCVAAAPPVVAEVADVSKGEARTAGVL